MTSMPLIDTHAHLDGEEFAQDYASVLAHSQKLGVQRIILPGVMAQGWTRLWELACTEALLWAAPGLHPLYVEQHQAQHITQLGDWLNQWHAHPKLCAIGEIGLDFWHKTQNSAKQQYYLEAQLELAAVFSLPVLLHVRRAHAPMIATLKRHRLQQGGIVHAFSGSLEEAKEYQKLGFYLGLGGAATWPQAKRMQRLLPHIPLEQVVLETDAPDMAPASRPHQRNSPEYLPEICVRLAGIFGVSEHQLAQISYDNACRLFGWVD